MIVYGKDPVLYRGYRLTTTSEGGTHIWYGDDLVDTKDRFDDAKNQVDKWLDAK